MGRRRRIQLKRHMKNRKQLLLNIQSLLKKNPKLKTPLLSKKPNLMTSLKNTQSILFTKRRSSRWILYLSMLKVNVLSGLIPISLCWVRSCLHFGMISLWRVRIHLIVDWLIVFNLVWEYLTNLEFWFLLCLHWSNGVKCITLWLLSSIIMMLLKFMILLLMNKWNLKK